MQDRVPLYPGRVKLTPVSGQENTYDMVRADQPTQEGTTLNKSTFLKDTTAALYGLGADAVPDDVFAWLGKFNEYWWKRSSLSYAEDLINFGDSVQVTNSTRTLQYSSTISIDASGNISLINPQSVSVNYLDPSPLLNIKPCYVTNLQSDTSGVYYIPQGVESGEQITYGINPTQYGMNLCNRQVTYGDKCWKIGSKQVFTDDGFVQSTNRAAYPDNSDVGTKHYTYIGIPFVNLPTAPKIETGSYVGTGTYGASNPNSLTFDFVPEFLFVVGKNSLDYFVLCYGISIATGSATHSAASFSWSGNTVSWYAASSQYQLNSNGYVYAFIAIA